MGKFREFYEKLQEEKLLKIKKNSSPKDITEPSKVKNGLNGLLKKEDGEVCADIVSQPDNQSNGLFSGATEEDERFVVAKPVFNNIQKRNDLSSGNEIDETVNFSTKLLDKYPSEPINLLNDRLIKNISDNKDIEGEYGYDVIVSPKNNLFPFVKENEITIQLNKNGVMRFETKWDDVSIKKEIKKLAKKKDDEDESKLTKLVTYLQEQNNSNLEVIKKFFDNMNDYYLFWKFDEKLNSIRKEDYPTEEEYQNARNVIQQKINDLKNTPSEDDVDNYIQSQEFYNVLKKMGNITKGDGLRAFQILNTVSKPRITYFYPTLIDTIRIYDEGQTSVKELPTTIIKKIDSNDENNPFSVVKESLYTDVANSIHSTRDEYGHPIEVLGKKSYRETNPQSMEIFNNDFNKDLGEIVYEFVSVKDGNWNRITDKGVLIGYGKEPKFTSIDIHTCFCMSYCDIPDTLRESKTFNSKYMDPQFIPIWLLKVGLENVVNKRITADHPGSLNGGKKNTRRFFN